MPRKYRSDEQLAKKIHRTKSKTINFDIALELCDKFLGSWLQVSAPTFQWFEVDGGDYELYIEAQSRGDFAAQVHSRKTA